MNVRLPKSFVTGLALIILSLLVAVGAALYVLFAPKVFSAQTTVMIVSASPQGTPIGLTALPLESFRTERNLIIRQAKGSSLVDIVGFGPTPDIAAALANQRAGELGEIVRSQLRARFSLVAVAEPNQRPIRPAKQKILSIAAIASMNLGIVGAMYLLVGFLRGRRPLLAEQRPAQEVA